MCMDVYHLISEQRFTRARNKWVCGVLPFVHLYVPSTLCIFYLQMLSGPLGLLISSELKSCTTSSSWHRKLSGHWSGSTGNLSRSGLVRGGCWWLKHEEKKSLRRLALSIARTSCLVILLESGNSTVVPGHWLVQFPKLLRIYGRWAELMKILLFFLVDAVAWQQYSSSACISS